LSDNASLAFRAFKNSWPITDQDGKAFIIMIGKRDIGTYYAAVTYRTRGTSTVRQFVTGVEAGSVEQAVANLFDVAAEAAHAACGEDLEGTLSWEAAGRSTPVDDAEMYLGEGIRHSRLQLQVCATDSLAPWWLQQGSMTFTPCFQKRRNRPGTSTILYINAPLSCFQLDNRHSWKTSGLPRTIRVMQPG